MAESGCLRDMNVQNLDVAGTVNFVGGFSLAAGGNVEAIAAPAAAEAAAASTIATTSSIVTLTQANDANDRVYLPSPTSVELGRMIVLVANAACELSSAGDGTTATTINNVAVTNANGTVAAEVALAVGTYIAIKVGANAWGLVGAVVAAADA